MTRRSETQLNIDLNPMDEFENKNAEKEKEDSDILQPPAITAEGNGEENEKELQDSGILAEPAITTAGNGEKKDEEQEQEDSGVLLEPAITAAESKGESSVRVKDGLGRLNEDGVIFAPILAKKQEEVGWKESATMSMNQKAKLLKSISCK